MISAHQLIDELIEFKKMPAAQRAKMARARKKPKSGARKASLKKARIKAKKPGAKAKAKKYRRKTKAFRR